MNRVAVLNELSCVQQAHNSWDVTDLVVQLLQVVRDLRPVLMDSNPVAHSRIWTSSLAAGTTLYDWVVDKRTDNKDIRLELLRLLTAAPIAVLVLPSIPLVPRLQKIECVGSEGNNWE